MDIYKERTFIIPVQIVTIGELEIECSNFIYRNEEKESQLEELIEDIERKVKYIYLNIRDINKYLNKEQRIKFYIDIYKAILDTHINNVKCFSAIKEKSIAGMNYQEVINKHLLKFEDNIRFHIENFKCYGKYSMGNDGVKIDGDDFIIRKNTIINEIEVLFRKVNNNKSPLTKNEIIEIHISMINCVIKLLINDIPCFYKVKEHGYNGKDLDNIIRDQDELFIKIFKKHEELLGCMK